MHITPRLHAVKDFSKNLILKNTLNFKKLKFHIFLILSIF
jgi:hypothetical protein